MRNTLVLLLIEMRFTDKLMRPWLTWIQLFDRIWMVLIPLVGCTTRFGRK